MRSELAERLRGANPVPATEAVAPDESLLLRIVATPHRATSCPTRRFSRRRAVTVLAAAVIVIGGIAAAATKFAPDYFGSDDREPTPAAVLAALRSYAREEPVLGGLGEIDAEGLLRVAAFDTETGRATIYVAPMRAGSGFCSVDAVDDEIRGGGCEDGTGRAAVPYMGSGSRDWGDIRVLLGRLETPAARIEVGFEDGAVRAASVRDPWWVYVVGGDETEPGLRPVELTALDPGGAVLARQELDPYHYTSQRAAEALLPEGDGSPGQNAIRAVLKGLGTGPWLEPEQLEIELTRLLRRIETRGFASRTARAPGPTSSSSRSSPRGSGPSASWRATDLRSSPPSTEMVEKSRRSPSTPSARSGRPRARGHPFQRAEGPLSSGPRDDVSGRCARCGRLNIARGRFPNRSDGSQRSSTSSRSTGSGERFER